MRLNGYTGGMKMNELELKYGCNPNQKPSRIFMADGSELPIKVLCGKPETLAQAEEYYKQK